MPAQLSTDSLRPIPRDDFGKAESEMPCTRFPGPEFFWFSSLDPGRPPECAGIQMLTTQHSRIRVRYKPPRSPRRLPSQIIWRFRRIADIIAGSPFGEVDEWFKSHAWKACLGE